MPKKNWVPDRGNIIKSFDWRQRNAKIHPWKHAPAEILTEACELLNQIITLTD